MESDELYLADEHQRTGIGSLVVAQIDKATQLLQVAGGIGRNTQLTNACRRHGTIIDLQNAVVGIVSTNTNECRW